MLFKPFNAEKDPATQGLAEASYDLIIASNVLHATASLEQTMHNVRRLLRPGGRLLLLEVTSDIVRVKLMMSGLPGWWLGAHDGRRLGPTITVSEWNALLLATGFSGVDKAANDFVDTARYMTSVMLTQAIDDSIRVLRQPLSSLGDWLSGRGVTIIGGTTHNVAGSISEALAAIKGPPSNVAISLVEGFATMPSELPSMRSVLVLEDLDEPLLKTLTQEKLQALERAMNEARQVLWVSKGCRKQDPYANMSIGLCRSLAAEFPHIQMQHIDVEEPDVGGPLFISRISEALARLVFKSTLESAEISWSLEPELVLHHGSWLVPRILPDARLNDQLNAGKMAIQTRSSLATETVQVDRMRSGFVVTQPAPSLDATASNGVWVRVTHSTLHPFRADNGAPVHLCLGYREHEPATQLLVVSAVCSSRVFTPEHCILDCSGAALASSPANLLQKALVVVLASWLFAGIDKGAKILLHHADGVLGAALRWKAAEMGLKCISTAFASSTWPGGAARGTIMIHPQSAERDIKNLIPHDVALLVDFVNGKAGEASLMRRCLPAGSDFIAVRDLFWSEHRQSRRSSLDFVGCVKRAL